MQIYDDYNLMRDWTGLAASDKSGRDFFLALMPISLAVNHICTGMMKYRLFTKNSDTAS